MGILDDAIRQHLDLKRQHGADEGDLKHLEDEVFGPATRPGEPDFPGQEPEGEAASTPAEAATATAEAAPEVADPPAPEAPSEPPPEPPRTPEPAAEPEAAPEPASPGPFSTEERDAIAAQPTEFFDQAPAELELGDLELDLEEEAGGAGEIAAEPVTGEEEQPSAPPVEPPPEELPAEPDSEEIALEPESAEQPVAVAVPGDAQPEGEPEAEEDEDVLEETPEFLRESPEDDELWFEQGEPKDFDF